MQTLYSVLFSFSLAINLGLSFGSLGFRFGQWRYFDRFTLNHRSRNVVSAVRRCRTLFYILKRWIFGRIPPPNTLIDHALRGDQYGKNA